MNIPVIMLAFCAGLLLLALLMSLAELHKLRRKIRQSDTAITSAQELLEEYSTDRHQVCACDYGPAQIIRKSVTESSGTYLVVRRTRSGYSVVVAGFAYANPDEEIYARNQCEEVADAINEV